MVKIAPSVLSADWSQLHDEIVAVEKAGADWIHVDVMDGRFVPNITMGMPFVRALKKITPLPLDVHLMIVEPENYISEFAKAGADIITVHAESTRHLDRTIHLIRESGCKAGVALNPATSPETIRYVMDIVDMVLVMTVNPGFGGQKLIPKALDKINTLRSWTQRSIEFQVDGGVNTETVSQVREAGATVLVAGSAVFTGNAADYSSNISNLKIWK